ncbi:MAG: hypothetical protein ABIF71_05055 [Planctomycetota bacterium]
MPGSQIAYTFTRTAWGVWRTYTHPDGRMFREYQTRWKVWGLPLIHFTSGKNPETGRLMVARGFIAVGRVSVGVIAIGQAAAGVLAFGQAAAGVLFFAQGGAGLAGVGQVAITLLCGIGQIATGYIAVGQVAVGWYALGQVGLGKWVWAMNRKDGAAVEFFRTLWMWFAG